MDDMRAQSPAATTAVTQRVSVDTMLPSMVTRWLPKITVLYALMLPLDTSWKLRQLT